MKSFSELNLIPQIDKALKALAFTEPTPIQAKAIPEALAGRDILACAQTGTGKTAAFAIPMITTLTQDKNSTALVLVPTRELAAQVTDVVRSLALNLPLIRVVSLIGGVSMQPQLRALSKGYRIIIATPGRLLDHLDRRSVTLDRVKVFTLDEADRMLDMGFAPQLRQIFRYLPEHFQTLLFSATLPPNILEMTSHLLKDPVRVEVTPISTAAPKITQKMKELKGDEKNNAILDEINARKGSILIFARTQARTDRLARYLEKYAVPVGRIHGGRTQSQRNRALDEFKKMTTRVLVATDIAARGIDIDHVEHVINYDLPQVPEDYVHRIGRTGRAGREGQALSLVAPEEKPLWVGIQKLLNPKAKLVQKTATPIIATRHSTSTLAPSAPASLFKTNGARPAQRKKFKPKRAFR